MKYLTTAVILFSIALTPTISFAAAYMKIGDIKGEAMDLASVRWMAPENVSKKQDSRAGKARGKTSSGNFSVIRELDKSSTKLQETMNSGGSFDEITVTQGNKSYLLKNVKVVSIEKRGKQEVVTMSFSHRQELGPAQRANHNSTRSNKTRPAGDSSKATDYNSSRSNKSL